MEDGLPTFLLPAALPKLVPEAMQNRAMRSGASSSATVGTLLAEPMTESGNCIEIGSLRPAIENSDHRHRRLLRPRRRRPRRRAADERDELAPPDHVWMAPAWQEIFGRAAHRSLAVMCPAC